VRKKIALVVCIGLVVVSLVGGCQSSAKKPVPEQKSDQGIQMTASERRVLASKLSQIAEDVEGVERATVVVSSIGITNAAVPNPGRTDVVNDENQGYSPDRDSQMEGNNANNGQLNNQVGQGYYNGMVVMVGLTLNQNTSNDVNKANSIEQTIKTKLKASDKRISQVLVTTDPNLIKRINDLAAGIIEGKPIQSFEKDINDLNSKLKQ